MSEANKNDTFKDLREMGGALAAEVAAQLARWVDPRRRATAAPLRRLNFIGHSVSHAGRGGGGTQKGAMLLPSPLPLPRVGRHRPACAQGGQA